MTSTSGTSAISVAAPSSAAHDHVGAPAPGADRRRASVMPRAASRRRASGATDVAGRCACRAGDRDDEPARDDVDEQRQHEQHQPGREQRRPVDRRRGGLAELVGDHRRERVALREDRSPSFGELPITSTTAIVSPIARPRPSIAPPVMPGARVREHRDPDHLPARRARAPARPPCARTAPSRSPRARSPRRSAGS